MEIPMSHDTPNEQTPPKEGPEDLSQFEARQERELEQFENKERQEEKAFEHHQREELEEFERQHEVKFLIKIDRTEYTVHQEYRTGQELRDLPKPPIGPDRDLFEVIPGGSDEKISADSVVKMHDGLRFFTAPAQINPG
jgi:hypothetical protein